MPRLDQPSQVQHEASILTSWEANAAPWIQAIRDAEIPSRTLCTNQAILNLILSLKPSSALDIGCGEGWLTDALQQHGIPTLGIDATPALMDFARQHRRGRYLQLDYSDLGKLEGERFDLAVCNFSLIGNESTEQVFDSVRSLLNTGGWLVIQTLHPVEATGTEPYQDGWRAGSWQGFSNDFCNPAPWYFRTIESWMSLFQVYGYQDMLIVEPTYLHSGIPSSVVFAAKFATGQKPTPTVK